MSEFERPDSSACPHDGWYNGNPTLMIENGTYDDYRDRLVAMQEAGKYPKGTIQKCDEAWKQIPLAEKKRRRDAVIADSTPVPVRTKDGKVEMLAKPSDNGAVTRRANMEKKHLSVRRAKGALSSKNDPIARQMAAEATKGSAKGSAAPSDTTTPKGSDVTREDALQLGAKPVPMA